MLMQRVRFPSVVQNKSNSENNITAMIILPTHKNLLKKRNELYEHMRSIVQCSSIHQIEDTMRKIHGINLKIRNYFIREYDYKETTTE